MFVLGKDLVPVETRSTGVLKLVDEKAVTCLLFKNEKIIKKTE
jgi:hypothetical protein